jgi:hypothetical protein
MLAAERGLLILYAKITLVKQLIGSLQTTKASFQIQNLLSSPSFRRGGGILRPHCVSRPPSTGNTTLLATLTALVVGKTNMGTSKIVLAAHSKLAVEVLVENTAHVLPTVFNQKPEDRICHVFTLSSAKESKLLVARFLPRLQLSASIDSWTSLDGKRRHHGESWHNFCMHTTEIEAHCFNGMQQDKYEKRTCLLPHNFDTNIAWFECQSVKF